MTTMVIVYWYASKLPANQSYRLAVRSEKNKVKDGEDAGGGASETDLLPDER